MGLFIFELGCREDIPSRGEHSLESKRPTVANEMIRYCFVIFLATKNMVTPAVTCFSTPESRTNIWVIDGQTKFSKHAKHAIPTFDAVAGDAAAHRNEW